MDRQDGIHGLTLAGATGTTTFPGIDRRLVVQLWIWMHRMIGACSDRGTAAGEQAGD